MNIEFDGNIWYWHGPAPWYFVTVPAKQCHDLMTIKVEIYPPLRAAPFVAAEHPAIKLARGVKVMDRKGEVKHIIHELHA